MKNIFKPLLFGLGGVAAMAAPVALMTSCASDSGFDSNKIGIYVEEEWKPAFEKAIEVYNKNFDEGGIWAKDKDTKTEIEIKTKGAFDAVGLLDSIGYDNQEVADLIYMPFDRISKAADSKAIIGFDEAGFKAVLGDEVSKEIMDKPNGETAPDGTISNEEFNSYANMTKFNNKYYAFTQNTEAVIAYAKGDFAKEDMSMKEIFEATNTDKWTTKMFNAKFYDLWFSIGILAGFMNSQDGKAVGEAIVKYDETTKKYVSDLANMTTATEGNSTKLKLAVENIANWLNASYNAGADWLLPADGTDTQDKKSKEKFKTSTSAWMLDGPWALNNMKEIGGKDMVALPVQPIIEDDPATTDVDEKVTFNQAPGGWAYAFNARNFKTDGTILKGKENKVRDMERFLQVIMGDDEVIKSMYTNAGKLTAGANAKKVLEATHKENTLDGQVIRAVYTSAEKALNQRPDTGNVKFGIAWEAWDQNGWRNKATTDLINKKEGFDANAVVKAIEDSFKKALDKANTEK